MASLPHSDSALEEMDLSQLGYFAVEVADPPKPSPGKKVVLATPKWVKDKLVRQFTEEARSEEEIERGWALFRSRRNRLLRDSDWSQGLGDVPDATKQAYAVYRQELRDLPEKTVDPFQPTWPTVSKG